MLVRLLPDQVANNWDLIKYAINESMMPTVIGSPEKMNNMFGSLLIGKMVCWASVRTDEEGMASNIEGIIITTVQTDGISGMRSLFIFCIYSFANESIDLTWREGLRKLTNFAISQRCDQIIGYTKNDNICKFVDRVGGDTSHRFVTIPLSQNGTQEE